VKLKEFYINELRMDEASATEGVKKFIEMQRDIIFRKSNLDELDEVTKAYLLN